MPISPKPRFTALEQAMKYLTVHGYAEKELALKLRRKGYSAAEVAEALASCRNYGFVNDRLVAEDYAALLASRGCGGRLIGLKLRQKGLAAPDIEAACAGVAGDEAERARASLDFKLRMLSREKDARKKREKCYRFLLSRGFSSSAIAEAMGVEDFSSPDADFDAQENDALL